MVCPIEADSVDLLASQSERFELRIRRRIPEQKHVSLNRPHCTLRGISQSTRRSYADFVFLFRSRNAGLRRSARYRPNLRSLFGRHDPGTGQLVQGGHITVNESQRAGDVFLHAEPWNARHRIATPADILLLEYRVRAGRLGW